MNKYILIALLITSTIARKNNWAVLVATSVGYFYYNHQSDVYHAYQIMKRNGIDESHIIVMSYDDVVNHSRNPLKGKMYNRPNGEDVYQGVKIDYQGKDVSPENLMNILKGNKAAMRGIGSGKVLESDSDSNVFFYVSGRAELGYITFPRGKQWDEQQIETTLEEMHNKDKYNKLVFYLECWHAGHVFERIKDKLDRYNIYAVAAADPKEHAWFTYCGKEAKVGGVLIGACLGDLFSVSWMEHSDAVNVRKVTIGEQFEQAKKRTASHSNVCDYGDTSVKYKKIIEFQGDTGNSYSHKFLSSVQKNKPKHKSIKQSDAFIYYLKDLATNSKSFTDKMKFGYELAKAVKNQKVLQLFSDFFHVSFDIQKDTNYDCYRTLINTLSDKCGIKLNHGYGNLFVLFNYCVAGDVNVAAKTIENICNEL